MTSGVEGLLTQIQGHTFETPQVMVTPNLTWLTGILYFFKFSMLGSLKIRKINLKITNTKCFIFLFSIVFDRLKLQSKFYLVSTLA